MDRRLFLQTGSAFAGVGALSLSGCARRITTLTAPAAPALPFYDAVGPIPPIRADLDRLFRITVCLRPFRAAGPRMEAERVGDTLVVHNYGHGGSGWSLSWGAAEATVRTALTAAPTMREIAVIGCGALGLTAALTAQRAGLAVTIYARERPPFVRSARATGSWTPDSRVALADSAPPAFAAQWEAMARASFSMYQSFLGLPGNPIEYADHYDLRDDDGPRRPSAQAAPSDQARHEFARYAHMLADITPPPQLLPPGATPFPTKYVRRSSSLTFNVAAYSHQLVTDFLLAGGKIETRQFHAPAELAALRERVVLNCTGYGARQLWADESIVPIRGQIAWLIPQEGVSYGFYYKQLNVLARRDGIVIQPSPHGEETGWNDPNEQPNREEAEAGVRQLQQLYARMVR